VVSETQVSARFDGVELAVLDGLADRWGVSRPAAVKRAVGEAAAVAEAPVASAVAEGAGGPVAVGDGVALPLGRVRFVLEVRPESLRWLERFARVQGWDLPTAGRHVFAEGRRVVEAQRARFRVLAKEQAAERAEQRRARLQAAPGGP